MSGRRIVSNLILLALLGGLAYWLHPYLKNVVRYVQLLREPAPASLPVPVEGVTRADLNDTWGAARSGGRTHQGIDIFAPRNTQVLAATRGIVTRRGWNRLGGRMVTVTGPGGLHHYYAHLEEWAEPDVGDWVEAGQVLGLCRHLRQRRRYPAAPALRDLHDGRRHQSLPAPGAPGLA